MSDQAVRFIVELAAALDRSGEAVSLNQSRVERIAAAYGVSDARVAVMPNVVIAGGRGTAPALERASPVALRLDQIGAISRLADQAERGAIEPGDGLRRLDHIAALPHRFGAFGVVAGHAVLTVGLALILQPTPVALITATVFGTLIGRCSSCC